MKNNDLQHQAIHQARQHSVRRISTDILVNPQVVQQNMSKLSSRPRKKRQINYAKKIQNDDFLMTV